MVENPFKVLLGVVAFGSSHSSRSRVSNFLIVGSTTDIIFNQLVRDVDSLLRPIWLAHLLLLDEAHLLHLSVPYLFFLLKIPGDATKVLVVIPSVDFIIHFAFFGLPDGILIHRGGHYFALRPSINGVFGKTFLLQVCKLDLDKPFPLEGLVVLGPQLWHLGDARVGITRDGALALSAMHWVHFVVHQLLAVLVIVS